MNKNKPNFLIRLQYLFNPSALDVQCNKCLGTGKNFIRTFNKGVLVSKKELPCQYCNGTGKE